MNMCSGSADAGRPSASGKKLRRQRREAQTQQENSVEVLMVLDYSIYYR